MKRGIHLVERTVLASFYSQVEAEQAERIVKQIGVETTQIAALHAHTGMTVEKQAFLISGNIPSLASLSMNITPSSRDDSVLLAADPALSGMSDGQDNITGRNFLLTVVCNNELVEQVVQIIRDYRGYT